MTKKDEWVDTILDEARQHGRTPVPLDVSALEEKLRVRLASGENPRLPLVGPPRVAPWKVLAGGLVTASAVAAAWALVAGPLAPPAVSPAAVASGQVAPASPGRRWLAGTGGEAPSLRSDGLASLWLSAGAQGWADERGGRLSFELARGAVSLDVTPQRQPDRVEVVADGVRVLVKGTRFRVAREGSRVDVDVDHGVVQVVPIDNPAAATTLTGPAGASFEDGQPVAPRALRPFATGATGATGGSTASGAATAAGAATASGATSAAAAADPAGALAAPAASGAASAASADGAPSAPVAPAGGGSAGAAPGKSRPVVSAADLPARAFALVSSCLSSSSSVSSGVVMTVETTLSLDIDDRGHAVALSFSPPLSPAAELCTRRSMARLGGAPGRHALPMSLSLGNR